MPTPDDFAASVRLIDEQLKDNSDAARAALTRWLGGTTIRVAPDTEAPDGFRISGQKCLHVGVLDGEVFDSPDLGTPQGSILSPLLGNVYLHHVLDAWFEREVKPRLAGRATLVRYADDLVIGFTRRDDAERVMAVLRKRMGRFGLDLHPDKTCTSGVGATAITRSKNSAWRSRGGSMDT